MRASQFHCSQYPFTPQTISPCIISIAFLEFKAKNEYEWKL